MGLRLSKNYFVIALIFLFFACNESDNKLFDPIENSIIVYKEFSISDTAIIFMYKLDGRSITAETYLAVAPNICSLKHKDFCVSGLFQDFQLIHDTLFVYSIYENGIDSINVTHFPVVQTKVSRFSNLGIDFDKAKKTYFKMECNGKTKDIK